MIATVTEARSARGEPVTPRDLWVAIATEYVFRLPSVRLADAHAAAAGPGVGTYSYLFTWESPMLDGYLGSCHALEIPFVFGTVREPGHPGVLRRGARRPGPVGGHAPDAWTSFARTGSPGAWPAWEPGLRPTQVLGPWPGRPRAWCTRSTDPAPEELDAVAAAADPLLAP